jgi:hypothetical protein
MCRVFVRLEKLSGLLLSRCLVDVAPLDEAYSVVCWYGVWEARHGVECGPVRGVLMMLVLGFLSGYAGLPARFELPVWSVSSILSVLLVRLLGSCEWEEEE